MGVTGGRTVDGYARAAGKRPAVFQFFVGWGDTFDYAFQRSAAAGGLIVPLSIYNGPGAQERITPRAIALGRGDRYLYSLGRNIRVRHRARHLPRPKVALQWTPMTAGSPNIAANRPIGYWPGAACVDCIGTDPGFMRRFFGWVARHPRAAGVMRTALRSPHYTAPQPR